MTDKELAAIEARAAAATPGPWKWFVPGEKEDQADLAALRGPGAQVLWMGNNEQHYPTAGDEPSMPDALFIAHARMDIPALVAEVKRLREALELVEWMGRPAKDLDETCPWCGAERGMVGDKPASTHHRGCMLALAIGATVASSPQG